MYPSYASRGMVAEALAVTDVAYDDALIDLYMMAASRAQEKQYHRRLYPERKTVTFDYPNWSYDPTWVLRLDSNTLVSLETLTAGGVTIDANDRFLRRGDDIDEPPYTRIELDLASSAVFSAGDTFQRAVSVLGVFGWNETQTTTAGGLLSANINNSVASVVINPSTLGVSWHPLSLWAPDVGSLLMCGTERMLVIERAMTDTGQNLQSNMDASQADSTVDVTDGTLFALGETIQLGAEKMRILSITGNTLTVRRAEEGTVLIAHTAPVDIYASRLFYVMRGVLGSTAAAHNQNDPVYRHVYPALAITHCVLETRAMLENPSESSEIMKQLKDVRDQALMVFGRKYRLGAI